MASEKLSSYMYLLQKKKSILGTEIWFSTTNTNCSENMFEAVTIQNCKLKFKMKYSTKLVLGSIIHYTFT